MESFVIYLIEANLILLVGMLYLKLFLRNSSPRLDRTFLLGTGFAALILPSLHIPLSELLPGAEPPIYWLDTIDIFSVNSLDSTASGVEGAPLIFWCYLIPGLLMLGGMIYGLLQIGMRLRKKPKIHRDGYTIVLNTGMGPSSFGSYLFWEGDAENLSDSSQLVMAHEVGHIRQKHTWDLMLFEFLRILFWFNPAVYVLYRELRQTHEFLADEAALTVGSKDSLSRVILASALNVPSLSMPHNFNSHIKKRIQMLAKSNSNSHKWKYFLALPLLFLAFYGTSLAQKGEAVDFEKEVDARPAPTNMNEVRTLIGYPKEAIDQDIEGKVIAQFIVDKKGNVASCKVLKSPSLILTQAVAEHVDKLKFTPGVKDGKKVKTQIMIPFKFQLSPKTKKDDCDHDQK